VIDGRYLKPLVAIAHLVVAIVIIPGAALHYNPPMHRKWSIRVLFIDRTASSL